MVSHYALCSPLTEIGTFCHWFPGTFCFISCYQQAWLGMTGWLQLIVCYSHAWRRADTVHATATYDEGWHSSCYSQVWWGSTQFMLQPGLTRADTVHAIARFDEGWHSSCYSQVWWGMTQFMLQPGLISDDTVHGTARFDEGWHNSYTTAVFEIHSINLNMKLAIPRFQSNLIHC